MNLIERLRCFGGTTPKYQKQAADEIERLRAELREYKQAADVEADEVDRRGDRLKRAEAVIKAARFHPHAASDYRNCVLCAKIVAYDKGKADD